MLILRYLSFWNNLFLYPWYIIGNQNIKSSIYDPNDLDNDRGIKVGDFGVYERSWHVEGDFIFANALDNRGGLASITQMLQQQI